MNQKQKDQYKATLDRLPDERCQAAYDAFFEQFPALKEGFQELPFTFPDMMDAIEVRQEELETQLEGMKEDSRLNDSMRRLFLEAHRAAICWVYRLHERNTSN